MRELLKRTIASKAGEGSGPMIHGAFMPYLDCCGKPFRHCRCQAPGKLTIGNGINLEDTGLSLVENDFILDRRIDAAWRDLVIAYPWVEQLDAVRAAVFTEMVFNMGLSKFRQFTETIGAAKKGDHALCAVKMLESRWAEQVGRRARRLAESMRTGVWQTT